MSHRAAPADDTAALPTTTPRAAATVTADGSGSTEDLAWISWLRVVAIAGVVCIHVAAISTGAHPRETGVGNLAIVLDFASRWSVPVFVMVSGALLLDPRRYRGHGHFLRRRALRLVPAVIVWHLVYLVYVEVHAGPLGLKEIAERVLTGRLYTALYFFWIVIGLAIITPVLMPWVAGVTRRAQLWVGLAAAALPALTLVTVPVRSDFLWDRDVSWVETPWTWWIPYLGYYLLGHALRDVVLTGWRLALAAAGAVGGSWLLIWQWHQDSGIAGDLQRFMPAEAYYSPTLILLAICVFLTAHGLIRPGGLLRVLCGRTMTAAGRRLGDATLGVYGVHLLVRAFVLALPVVGGADLATSLGQLLARCATVFVIAYVIALVASRVPYVRRVF